MPTAISTGYHIKELSDSTDSEPTPDIYIGCNWQDIRIQNDKYMSFVMFMLIMTICLLLKYTYGRMKHKNST